MLDSVGTIASAIASFLIKLSLSLSLSLSRSRSLARALSLYTNACIYILPLSMKQAVYSLLATCVAIHELSLAIHELLYYARTQLPSARGVAIGQLECYARIH